MRTAAPRRWAAALVPTLVTAGLLSTSPAWAGCWVNDEDFDQKVCAGDPATTITISCDLTCQVDLSGVDEMSLLAVSRSDGTYVVDPTFSLTVTFPESATVDDRQKFEIYVYDPGDIPAHDPGGDQCFLSVPYKFKVVGEGGENDP